MSPEVATTSAEHLRCIDPHEQAEISLRVLHGAPGHHELVVPVGRHNEFECGIVSRPTIIIPGQEVFVIDLRQGFQRVAALGGHARDIAKERLFQGVPLDASVGQPGEGV
jgi:hypothetical protein